MSFPRIQRKASDKVRTRTVRSGDQPINHEATVPTTEPSDKRSKGPGPYSKLEKEKDMLLCITGQEIWQLIKIN